MIVQICFLIPLLSLCVLGQPNEVAPATPPLAKRGGSPNPTRLDGCVWGGVIFASGENDPSPDEEVLEPSPVYLGVLPRLKTVFSGYKRFRLLGEHRGDLFREYENGLVPSRDFFFRLDSFGPMKGNRGLRVNFQIWRDKDVILKTNAALLPGNALFVGGQKWGKGRIIFVVILESGRPDKP